MVKLRFPLRFCLCPSHVVAQKALEGGLQNRLAAILETAEGQSRQSVLRNQTSKSETKSQKKEQRCQGEDHLHLPVPRLHLQEPLLQLQHQHLHLHQLQQHPTLLQQLLIHLLLFQPQHLQQLPPQPQPNQA